MKIDIKKRKRQFWVFFSVLVFMLVQLMPGYMQWENHSAEVYNAEAGSVAEETTEEFIERHILGSGGEEVPGWSPTSWSISYDLDGGTNGYGNPSSYTEGYGVSSFGDAQKDGYTFAGWYRDSAFTNQISSISGSEWGDITLYARFIPKKYSISYVLDGGSNAEENPAEYTYGEGVGSLAEAVKKDYKFEGWYRDSAFTEATSSISGDTLGDITLYAKFTKLLEGEGSVSVDDIFYGEELKPVIKSDTNGLDNVKVEYKEKGQADSGYTTSVPSKVGEYTIRVTFAKTDKYLETVATADFSILKKKGEGSISVDDVCYGLSPQPKVKSKTNGTDNVVIQYKHKSASDDTYTGIKPDAVGIYTVRAVFAETDIYQKVVSTADFSIKYLDMPKPTYSINGTRGQNGYYTSVVSIIPAEGYLVANAADGNYIAKIDIYDSMSGCNICLKKADTGEMTQAISVPEIKIDRVAPVLSNAAAGQTIYGDEYEVNVTDENLNQVLVNGENAAIENGRATLKLASNNGEESYEIIGTDEAGNKTQSIIVVAAEWMKSKIIPGGQVNLFSKYSYRLGSGNWKVAGDSTTYSGNIDFYVSSDGEYSFAGVN